MTEEAYRQKTGKPPKSNAPGKQTVDVTSPSGSRRRVPEDGPERDKALKGFRVYSRMLVKLIDKLNQFMEAEELDSDEKEAGIEAFSALLYQESAQLDARHLVALWLVTTEVPRGIAYLEKKTKEKKTPIQKLEAELKKETNGD